MFVILHYNTRVFSALTLTPTPHVNPHRELHTHDACLPTTNNITDYLNYANTEIPVDWTILMKIIIKNS